MTWIDAVRRRCVTDIHLPSRELAHYRGAVKHLEGRAQAEVGAPVRECFALLRDFEGYPSWYPEVVRSVEVVDRDANGEASKAHARLSISVGPLVRAFDLMLAVRPLPPTMVTLTRLPHDPSDPEQFEVAWQVIEGQRTRIALKLDANLSVPRMLPVGTIGDTLAQGFVDAAARRLSG